MKQDLKNLNFWARKVAYFAMRTAQDFLNPNKLQIAYAMANSECYGTCGEDTGCASNSDCSACSSDDGGDGGDGGDSD